MNDSRIKTTHREFTEEDFELKFFPKGILSYVGIFDEALILKIIADAKEAILQVLSGHTVEVNRVNVQAIAKDDDWTKPPNPTHQFFKNIQFTDPEPKKKKRDLLKGIKPIGVIYSEFDASKSISWGFETKKEPITIDAGGGGISIEKILKAQKILEENAQELRGFVEKKMPKKKRK